VKYVIATPSDSGTWLDLALKLWPYEDRALLERFYHERFDSDRYRTIFCQTDEGKSIAFADLSIRQEYVEGSDTSPVGYVEGLYVEPEYRKQGIASELVRMGETWSRERGCSEYGSDTELSNVDSQNFHERYGFEKAETIVHFIKKI
jgi:aminoglycoside 6'-N-acetyltransferase I